MSAVKNIAIIGRIGTGKSATGNTLCGNKIFKSNFSANSVTENCSSHKIQCEEHNTILRIIDTPGISGNTEQDNHFLIELKKVLNEYNSGIHAILLVLSLRESFTKAVKDSFVYFTSILGDKWEQFGILIFTNSDLLGDPLNAMQYIKKSKAFSKIRKPFGKKYFAVDNTKHCPKQLSQLYSLILETIDQNGSSVYTDARLTSAEICRGEHVDTNAEMLLVRQFDDKWKTESMHMKEKHARNEQDLKTEAKLSLKHSSHSFPPVKLQENDSEDTTSSNEGLHKGTVSRFVSDVLTSLCNKRDDFIKWPRNVDETRGDFYRLSAFPNVLGAIDGTHVRIQAPSEDEASFVNSKGVHPVNVQAVCDAIEQDCSPIIKWLVKEDTDLIPTTNDILDTDDDYIGHNNLEVCSMCEELGPNTFCKECKINLCIKCTGLHDNVLKAHKTKGITSKVCKLPAECSIQTECAEPKYICFHCVLVFCKNCFGIHMDKNDEHRVLDASTLRIIHRKHKEAQNLNQPVLMVVFNLKKNISKCGLYFHPFVVCRKISEETLDKYQLIKYHDMERSQNVQSLKLSEKRGTLQAKLLHVVFQMKRDVKEMLKKRLIFLQDEDILWVLSNTSLLKEIMLTTLSKDDIRQLDPSVVFEDEVNETDNEEHV